MIYLVRHGQTDWNKARKLQGQADVQLNDTGREQARKLAEKIKDLKIDKIITSDLSRAIETGKIINEKFNVKMSQDKRLREYNFGKLEGESADKVFEDERFKSKEILEKYGVELDEECFARIKNFFDELDDDSQNILIVAHGGILRVVMAYARNKEKFDKKIFQEVRKNIIPNTSIFKWDGEIKLI